MDETGKKDFWQAGKSAGHITSVRSVADIMDEIRKCQIPEEGQS
jgi:hypothetical protein